MQRHRVLLTLLAVSGCAGTEHSVIKGVDDGYYYELVGDVQVPVEAPAGAHHHAHALGAAGITKKSRIWAGGTINYMIETASTNPGNPASSTLSKSDPRIKAALEHWEQKTCIRFTECTSCSAPYIKFISDASSCNSPVGKIGSVPNQINLAAACGTGAIIHEIGHSLGLGHEQARNDRDEFVYVDFTQVQTGMSQNFDKTGADGRDIGPYDYGSIMHYGASGFTIGNKPTIIAPVPIGQRTGLSDGDVEAIQFMYNKCSTTFADVICIASENPDIVHNIPHSQPWTVEFNAQYTSGKTLTVTYDDSDTPASQVTFSVADKGTMSDSDKTKLVFTPASTEKGKTFTLAATFTAADSKETTCSVQVKVANTDAVCFGIPSDDDAVCGGRGDCTNDALAPCDCESTYGGLECLGFANCPANYLYPFDEDIGTWAPVRHTTVDTAFFAQGSGALKVGDASDALDGQAQLQLVADSKPDRITFWMARFDASLPAISFRAGDTTCFQVFYRTQGWILNSRIAGYESEKDKYYHFDLRIDWTSQKVDLYVDGLKDLSQVGFQSQCTSGINAIILFGNGWWDELHLWCTSYIKLTGTVTDTFGQANLVAGGATIVLTLVGDHDEWINSTSNKQAIIDSLRGDCAGATGWNALRSSMIDTSLVKIAGAVVTIGPLKAASTYAQKGTELVRAQLTATMFKSEQSPIWDEKDVEFQIKGTDSSVTCDAVTDAPPDVDSTAPEVSTDAPATSAPATDAPSTNAPDTLTPQSEAPETSEPVTSAPVTSAPATNAPSSDAPATGSPATAFPVTSAPATTAPSTEAPVTDAPETSVPETAAPTTLPPPTGAPITTAPSTEAPATDAPETSVPET
ncbi:hypothetical protein DIPPA_63054, partial [Diplonema papillatum]